MGKTFSKSSNREKHIYREKRIVITKEESDWKRLADRWKLKFDAEQAAVYTEVEI